VVIYQIFLLYFIGIQRFISSLGFRFVFQLFSLIILVYAIFRNIPTLF